MPRKRISKFEDCMSILRDFELCNMLATEQAKRAAMSPHKSAAGDLIEKSDSCGCGNSRMTSDQVAAASLPKSSEVNKARLGQTARTTRLGECLIRKLENGVDQDQAIRECLAEIDSAREYKEPVLQDGLKPISSDEVARLSLPKRQRLG